ncbi:hypothetical protein DKX38_012366 [Salix brachista]|uniref:MD-2-related lipid-recognition domain-containing protein n=1 Tax=Salix brachista TaxID=2182728 RepID=A0A5N5LN75_9ROSI|nr:hypothetical protein DKX38_012366 [Salix brachista]
MKMALYKLISLCLILPMTLASKFEYCGNKDYAVKVSGVKISPNPVKKGKPATFIISATTSKFFFLRRLMGFILLFNGYFWFIGSSTAF